MLALLALALLAQSDDGLMCTGIPSNPRFSSVTATNGTFGFVDAGLVLSENGFEVPTVADGFLIANRARSAGIRLGSSGAGLQFCTTNGSAQWEISAASGDLTSAQARNINTTGMGIFKGAGGGLRVGPAGSNVIEIAAGGSTVTWAAYSTYSGDSSMIYTPRSQTVASDGAGTAAAFNIDIGSAGGIQLSIDCQDANGCNATLLETSVVTGQIFCATNISANAVNFADTAGVSEIAGAFAAGQYDMICFQYVTDRWVERSRSNN